MNDSKPTDNELRIEDHELRIEDHELRIENHELRIEDHQLDIEDHSKDKDAKQLDSSSDNKGGFANVKVVDVAGGSGMTCDETGCRLPDSPTPNSHFAPRG